MLKFDIRSIFSTSSPFTTQTLSSLVIASASTVVVDLVGSYKELEEKKRMWLLRGLIVAFIVISAALAIFQIYGPEKLTNDIASLMGISWGAISGAFIGPFLYGLYWKKTTNASVWTSFISGVVLAILCMILKMAGVGNDGTFFGVFVSDSIYMGVVAMLFSLIIVPVVSLFTKKPDQDMVNDLFKCYESSVEALNNEPQANDTASEALVEDTNTQMAEQTK